MIARGVIPSQKEPPPKAWWDGPWQSWHVKFVSAFFTRLVYSSNYLHKFQSFPFVHFGLLSNWKDIFPHGTGLFKRSMIYNQPRFETEWLSALSTIYQMWRHFLSLTFPYHVKIQYLITCQMKSERNWRVFTFDTMLVIWSKNKRCHKEW